MGIKILLCEWCKIEFEVFPSRADKARFCSQLCANLWKSENLRGENSPLWKPEVKKKCTRCGKIFKIKPGRIATRKFCSRECTHLPNLTKICEQCKIEFEVFPSQSSKKFCSRRCYGLWYSENQHGENSPSWKGGEAKITCEQCGKEFNVVQARVDTRRFCSLNCSGLWQSENQCGENNPLWKGGNVQETCKWCGKGFEKERRLVNQKFCSRSCWRLWHLETMRGENSPHWRGGKAKRLCKNCGEEFNVWPFSTSQKLCSRKCMGESQRGENSHLWKGGISLEPYGPDWTDRLKEAVRKRDNYTCAISGEVWQPGHDKFHVHHIDYNKKNSMRSNLITLELSSHIKTNSHRSLWQALLEPIAQAREKVYDYPTKQNFTGQGTKVSIA